MRKSSLLFIAILFTAVKLHAATVYASSFGYNTTNATAALQAAINSGNSTVIVDVQAGDWNIGPVFIDSKNTLTLIFKPGVILHALPGQFPNDGDCLFEIKNSQNINLVGYGATFLMNKSEYLTGEKRHAIAIQNAVNVSISGLLIQNSGGDGIFIGADYTSAIKYSENISLLDCVCDSSKRQGLTIDDAKAVNVSHCEFSNSNGGAVAAGVNIEPSSAADSINNIIFERCRFINNQNSGMRIAFDKLNTTSKPVSVTFFRCYSSGNGDSEIRVTGKPKNSVSGYVNFNLCLMDSSQNAGAYFRKSASGFIVGFNECVFRDVAQSNAANIQPIMAEITSNLPSVGRYGGINFGNILVTYNANKPWFKAINNSTTSTGLGNVTGFVAVWNPAQNSNPDFGSNPGNVTVNDSLIVNWPVITVTTYVNDNIAGEGTFNKANFKIERTRTKSGFFPMCATYKISGTAINGLDYSRIVGFQLMPVDSAYLKDSLYGLIDGLTEPDESIIYTLNSSWMYVIGAKPSSTLYIKGNSLREPDELSANIESKQVVYYNMQSQQLMIPANVQKIKTVEVYNTTGALVLKTNYNEAIDFSVYETGLYIASLCNENGEVVQRKKFVKN